MYSPTIEVSRINRLATSIVVWTIMLCLVGTLTIVGVVVVLPLYYRDRGKARRSHQGEGTCKAST